MNRRCISIAPMMDCTDRHFRMLLRCISQHTYLYTEMLTANAVIHGDRDYLLGFDDTEQPLAVQLGGSDPKLLASAAGIAEDFGYSEVNLNVGCPSPRVQAGRFGACLMQEPELVAELVTAMQAKVKIPVTVKTRIGVDEQDSYAELVNFVQQVVNAGCHTLIVHARKAWLKGLSPKQNREVPPLNYSCVYQLKQDFPTLEIIINGGIKTLMDIKNHLNFVDGVMLGRAAYANPYLFANIDQVIYGADYPLISKRQVVLKYLLYVAKQLKQGVPLRHLTRHLVGLFQGEPGAKKWRRYLSENSHDNRRGVAVIEAALDQLMA
ncbi:MAG: tRNA dihydrouridine(20/20a) synthase DusA [Gammaproteobacteria bacterium]|nr:tRNA dihydrouridine(20/20a) synthase DusA [Gammaproteobacteria bacterium]